MQLHTDCYRGKRVLVTGADGFMGSHLTERLLDLGAAVTVYVRGTSVTGTAAGHQLKNIPHLLSHVSVIAGDIGNADAISLITKNNPDIIFHLAAEAYVNRSFDHPLEVCRTNIDGTLRVLEAARALKGTIERVVVTSSSEAYGHSSEPISENHPFDPSTPYGASKAAADVLARSYHHTFGLPIAVIRPFNTFGPRHTYDVIPKFITLALQGKPLPLCGDGKQTRDMTYVEDTINGFLIMGSHPAAIGKAINFGTGIDTPIIAIAHMIQEMSGTNPEIVHKEPRAGEVARLCSNPSQAKALFGWEAQIPIREGIKRNIAWAKEHQSLA